MNTASQLPWSQQSAPSQNFPNGQHLGAPPNLPAPSTYNTQGFPGQQSQQMQLPQQHGLGQHQDIGSLPQQARQNPQSATQTQLPNHVGDPNLPRIAQTPAQQVLLSPADRWGLLALLASIKGMDPDAQLLAVGTDLSQLNLDLSSSGNLSSTFTTPWADLNASQAIEPEFRLPACYNVQAPLPGPQKVGVFTDETLFYMFYSAPRDTLQEIASQELYNRNWRYHKEAKVWLTKDPSHEPSQKDASHETGMFTFWDAHNWMRAKREAAIYYEHLEERALSNGGVVGSVVGAQVNGTSGGATTPMGGQPTQQQQQIPLRG